MKAMKVALNMSTLSIPAKISRANFIVSGLTGNVNYPSPTPTLLSINNAITNLGTAWNNAADGGKTKTALMHDAEADLMILMNKLAHYIEDNSGGLVENIHSTDLTLKKFVGQSVPQNTYWVKNGEESGEIVAKIKAGPPHAVYHWQYTNDMGSNNWTDYMSTHSRVHIKNLMVGQKYWLRISYIDKNGEHTFTTAIEVIVV